MGTMSLVLMALLVGTGGVAVYLRRYRARSEEGKTNRRFAEQVLSRLARDEPLPADVELHFLPEHPATGAPAPPVSRARFLSALRAGPFRYPSTVVSYEVRGTWAAGFWAPAVAQQTYQTADAQRFDVLTRRHGGVWQVAVVEPRWPPNARPPHEAGA
jgi:hypothetical protein